jgi:hypothetical protein
MTLKRSASQDRGTHLRLVDSQPLPLSATPAAPSRARDRVQIVPLPEPPSFATVTPLAPPLAPPMPVRGDRRGVQPTSTSATDVHARLVCPACARRARIDHVDLSTRRVHLSCDRCYRMWQEQIRADDPARLSRRS